MKILTQNCWGVPIRNRRRRFDIIAETIENRHYDIVCLQEIFLRRWHSQSFHRLDEYNHSYQEGFISLKSGLLTLTKQTPKEVTFHRYQAQGNLFSQQVTDAILGKGFLETIIEHEELHEDLTIINVHNVSVYRPRHNQEMHLLAQSEQLFEYVKKKIEKGRKIILAGDFNFERESMPYYAFANLLEDMTSSLESLLDFIGNSEEETQHIHREFVKHPAKGNQLDFVFSNIGKTKKSQYVTHISQYPSDHLGISVKIEADDR
ncbi:MAG: endonuclease/exonuclease/phosphatase family protein [Nanoarchaeota archaeon]